MESRQVRHFLAAYDLGTFGAAAARLGLSQQAISKSIQRLEEQLGVRLFERDGRRIRATVYADLFLPHARTIAAETDRFRIDLEDMLGGRQGRLRVGVGPSAAADVAAKAIQSLVSDRRELRLDVLGGVYDAMVNDLVLGKLDLVVAVRQVERHDPLVREEVVGSIRYAVVAGARHPLAGREGLTLADLAGERWLAGANLGAVEIAIDASFRSVGIGHRRAEIETTSVPFTLAMLDSGIHLSILPEMMVARDVEAGRLVTIDVAADPWMRPLIVATRARAQRPALIDKLVESIAYCCSQV